MTMRILMVLILAVVLAGCGAAATPTGDTTAVPGTDTTAVPAAPPTQTAAADMIGPSAQVMASLVQQLGLDSANLQFVSAEEQEWPDSGLGCPKKGMMYTQVITPGYKITFSDGSTTYEVHTDQTGDNAVLCQNGQPTDLPAVGS